MASQLPDSTPPPTPSDADLRTVPLHLEISKQARILWASYGQPTGRDVAIWLEAERQVLGTDAQARKQAAGTVAAAPLADTLYPTDPTEAKTENDATVPPNKRPTS